MKRQSNENPSTFLSHDSVVNAFHEFIYNPVEVVTFTAYYGCYEEKKTV